jgi:hypothetical protein
MLSDVTEVPRRGATLLVLQVGNKPVLLRLGKLIGLPAQHGKADHNFAIVLFRVREPRRALRPAMPGWIGLVAWADADRW